MKKYNQTRKIKPNYRSVTGHISYHGESLAYESTLERDFLVYQTFRDGVIDITPQPISIPFKKNGRAYKYTPDYLVQVLHGYGKSMIVEVKPKSEWQANWRDWSGKWKATMQFCKEQDFRFAIYDEDRIRHYGFQNLDFILRYKNLYTSQEEIKSILKDIELREVVTVNYLLERYFKGSFNKPRGWQIIWHLMANKMVGFDLWNNVRTESMEVWHVG